MAQTPHDNTLGRGEDTDKQPAPAIPAEKNNPRKPKTTADLLKEDTEAKGKSMLEIPKGADEQTSFTNALSDQEPAPRHAGEEIVRAEQASRELESALRGASAKEEPERRESAPRKEPRAPQHATEHREERYEINEVGGTEEKPKLRDPLYAAKILEQERKAPAAAQSPGEAQPESISGQERKKAPETPKTQDNKEESKKKPHVRTYKDDVARALRKEQTSQVQMVLAEKRKHDKAQEQKRTTKKRSAWIITASTTLIIVGLGVVAGSAWFFLLRDADGPEKTQRIDAPSPIFTETTKAIDITNLSSRQVVSRVQAELQTLNTQLDFVEHVFFTEQVRRNTEPTIEEPQTIQTVATTQRFFGALRSRMPNALSRALGNNFMYGIHSFNGNQPFIILKTRFFENAFAGLLEWEQYMASDLLPLFGTNDTSVERGARFADVVRKSRDLRVLHDTSGEVVLLYTFYNENTVIITAAEETLDEVVTRLNRT